MILCRARGTYSQFPRRGSATYPSIGSESGCWGRPIQILGISWFRGLMSSELKALTLSLPCSGREQQVSMTELDSLQVLQSEVPATELQVLQNEVPASEGKVVHCRSSRRS